MSADQNFFYFIFANEQKSGENIQIDPKEPVDESLGINGLISSDKIPYFHKHLVRSLSLV